MKRSGATLILFLVLAFCLQGCGDKEKGEAMAKWATFQAEQVATIQAEHSGDELIPYDFEQEFLEVEDLPYRFKGLISFKRGSIFQEQSYAYMDGIWTPVKYLGPEDKKAEKQRRQNIERIEKRISDLTEEIEKEEEDLDEYRERLERLEAKKTELETLQAELEELSEKM